ncbi:MAG TPA: helix-turn-helix domain-containing protein [Candidatus Polarisedimenticolia bacterium]|nr:helix-turn-helix domain-containing protein [Candidatus Polarisedimenticolia bacterium]
MARPPDGLKSVDKLEGSEETKQRLQVLLQTLTGELSITQACELLGVGEARLHVLRRQVLQGALEALEPVPAGRPRHSVAPEAERIRELEEQVRELKFDLRASLVRTELALTMPHLMRRAEQRRGRKKNSPTRSGSGGKKPPRG